MFFGAQLSLPGGCHQLQHTWPDQLFRDSAITLEKILTRNLLLPVLFLNQLIQYALLAGVNDFQLNTTFPGHKSYMQFNFKIHAVLCHGNITYN